jgi:hypothetical protein
MEVAMSMLRHSLTLPVLMAALAAPLASAAEPRARSALPTPEQVTAQIMEVDWNLKHSSVSVRLDASTRSRSERLLDRARDEIAAGHLKTARGLIRQAAVPLVAMKPSEQTVAHPSRVRQLVEMRATLKSITRGAEEIALQKGLENTLVADTRAVIQRSEDLQRAGQFTRAKQHLQERSQVVNTLVAEWRDGRELVVRAPDSRDEKQWYDGVRRIDERRQITEYLIVEAKAEGIDPAPLHEALSVADRSLETASGHAKERRWDQAYRSLDLAYAQIEASWKKVGIEW